MESQYITYNNLFNTYESITFYTCWACISRPLVPKCSEKRSTTPKGRLKNKVHLPLNRLGKSFPPPLNAQEKNVHHPLVVTLPLNIKN